VRRQLLAGSTSISSTTASDWQPTRRREHRLRRHIGPHRLYDRAKIGTHSRGYRSWRVIGYPAKRQRLELEITESVLRRHDAALGWYLPSPAALAASTSCGMAPPA
jgi:hypothetical protein